MLRSIIGFFLWFFSFHLYFRISFQFRSATCQPRMQLNIRQCPSMPNVEWSQKLKICTISLFVYFCAPRINCINTPHYSCFLGIRFLVFIIVQPDSQGLFAGRPHPNPNPKQRGEEQATLWSVTPGQRRWVGGSGPPPGGFRKAQQLTRSQQPFPGTQILTTPSSVPPKKTSHWEGERCNAFWGVLGFPPKKDLRCSSLSSPKYHRVLIVRRSSDFLTK